jgi:integrase
MPSLTELELKALRPDSAGKTLSDGNGLFGVVRVSKEGVVSVRFFYRYRRDGKPHNLGCGTWPKVSLKEVRREHEAARRLHRDGTDPSDDRRRKALEQRASQKAEIAHHEAQLARPTVRQLFERWAASELAERKDGGAETKRGLEKDVLSAIGDRYADDITRADIMGILDAVKARNANRLANRLLAEMRQMFGFAAVREIVKVDPTYGIKKRDVGGKDAERDRTLSEDEIRTLPAKLEAANLLVSTKHAVWIMLSTLARIGELTNARKADIDLDAGTWTIPAEHSKNGKPHTVYLSEFAMRHMRSLLALSDDPVWLLPATRNDGPVCNKSITKQLHDRQRGKQKTNGTALTTALSLPGGAWTPHDLRRTGATLMGELGVHGDVIEKCLNHTEENKIKRTYQRAIRQQEQIEAWRRLGDRLDLLTREDAENVVTLAARAANG